MYCMKCGRAIRDDQVFCASCSRAPVIPISTPVPQKAKTIRRTEKKTKPKKQVNYKAVCSVLSVTLVLVALLFGALAYIALNTADRYQQRQDALRQKEVAVALREKEADSRDARIEELEEELEQVKNALEDALRRLNP